MGIEQGGEVFSEPGGGASEIVADTVKGPLSMVFQDGSAVVFPKNFSPIQESRVVLGGNAASVSTKRGVPAAWLVRIPFQTKTSPSLLNLADFWECKLRV